MSEQVKILEWIIRVTRIKWKRLERERENENKKYSSNN